MNTDHWVIAEGDVIEFQVRSRRGKDGPVHRARVVSVGHILGAPAFRTDAGGIHLLSDLRALRVLASEES